MVKRVGLLPNRQKNCVKIVKFSVNFQFVLYFWFGLWYYTYVYICTFLKTAFEKEEIMPQENTKKINVRGVYFDNVTKPEAFEIAKGLINDDSNFSAMYTPNSEIVQCCIEDEKLYDVINSASLVIPDGIGVVYAAKILKTPLKEKVAGCEMAELIVEYASQNGIGLYLFGGGKATETEPCVARIAADNLCKKYPGLVVSGVHDGYFNADNEHEIIEDINNSGAKVLFVCLGAPKQEKWIYDNRERLKVNFAAGLGGSIDVFANKVKRAPKFFVKANLEWFYRLIKEPKRIGRMMKLPKFLFGTIIHKNKGHES